MKLGNIVKPNTKGQIVIPNELRKKLGIDSNTHLNLILKENAIHIYPLNNVNSQQNNKSYQSLLEKTKGTWANDSWEEDTKKQDEIELKAAKKLKDQW